MQESSGQIAREAIHDCSVGMTATHCVGGERGPTAIHDHLQLQEPDYSGSSQIATKSRRGLPPTAVGAPGVADSRSPLSARNAVRAYRFASALLLWYRVGV